jgi:hypothetical protein
MRVKNTFVEVTDEGDSDDDLLARTCPSRPPPSLDQTFDRQFNGERIEFTPPRRGGEHPIAAAAREAGVTAEVGKKKGKNKPPLLVSVDEQQPTSDTDPLENTYASCSSGALQPDDARGAELPVAQMLGAPPLPETPSGFDDHPARARTFRADNAANAVTMGNGQAGKPRELDELAGNHARDFRVKNTFIHVEESSGNTPHNFAMSCPSGVFPAFPKLPGDPAAAQGQGNMGGDNGQEPHGEDSPPGKRKRRRPGVRRRRARPLLHAAVPADQTQPQYANPAEYMDQMQPQYGEYATTYLAPLDQMASHAELMMTMQMTS